MNAHLSHLTSQLTQSRSAVEETSRETIRSERWSWSSVAAPTLAAIIALSFVLRVVDLTGLSLQGDYAYSVYAARQDVSAIARERLLDGHPPLYYYLLHFWMLVAGQSELTVRIPSVLIGVLLVPLAYVFGARHFGRPTGLLASLLVAVSPALVHYSRMPRMYILLALLGLASASALATAIERNRKRDWAGYALATSLLLYTHYYGLVLVVAEMAFVLLFHREPRERFLRWLVALGASGAVYLPWLLFAAVSSAKATAGIISNAPWPDSIWGVLEQIWVPFNVGDYLDVAAARPLALAMTVVWVAALLLGRRQLIRHWDSLRLPAFAVALPVAAALLAFPFVPYAVRPRFLIFCIPFYLILLAAVLGRNRVWAAIVGIVVSVTVSGYALVDLYQTEPYVREEDAVSLTEYVQQVAQPGEAVVFHAFWQIGYFTTHYEGEVPITYSLRDLPMEDVEETFGRHPRVWLAMYQVGERDPAYPIEDWLDRHWHKTDQVQFGPTRLAAYVRPSADGWRNALYEFGVVDYDPVLRLTATQQGTTRTKPGKSVAVGLKWQALRPIRERYTVFVQLLDSAGQRWAGADREPLGGSEPTAGWHEGKAVCDLTGFVVPRWIPPGDYTIRVGLHPTGDPHPLRARALDGSVYDQGVTIGHVHVDSHAVEELRMRHPVRQKLGEDITLLGCDLNIDFYQTEHTRVVRALTDHPIQLAFPKRGYRASDAIEITLYWEALHPVDQDYTVFIHLVDSNGQLLGQADGHPVGGSFPTSRWRAGDVIVDHHRLEIDPTAAQGEYRLQAGMYLLSTMERLPVAGNASGVVELGSITVQGSGVGE